MHWTSSDSAKVTRQVFWCTARQESDVLELSWLSSMEFNCVLLNVPPTCLAVCYFEAKYKYFIQFSVVCPVRNCRFGAVQSAQQLMYLIVCITKGVMAKEGVLYWRSFDAITYYHEQILADKYHDNNDGPTAERAANMNDTTVIMEDYCDKKLEEFKKAHPNYEVRKYERAQKKVEEKPKSQ